jgi:hypothetical protein
MQIDCRREEIVRFILKTQYKLCSNSVAFGGWTAMPVVFSFDDTDHTVWTIAQASKTFSTTIVHDDIYLP